MKMLHTLLIVAVAALVLAALPAQAQLGIYGNFSTSSLTVPSLYSSSDRIYGGGGGAYLDHGHFFFFSAGVDLRADFQSGNSSTGGGTSSGGTSTSTRIYTGYIGPRVAFRPHILPIKPYVEGLVGAANIQSTVDAAYSVPHNGIESLSESETRFSYKVVGGLDYTVVPRIDWRVVEVAYSGVRAFGANVNPVTLSTGLVIRLPGIF